MSTILFILERTLSAAVPQRYVGEIADMMLGFGTKRDCFLVADNDHSKPKAKPVGKAKPHPHGREEKAIANRKMDRFRGDTYRRDMWNIPKADPRYWACIDEHHQQDIDDALDAFHNPQDEDLSLKEQFALEEEEYVWEEEIAKAKVISDKALAQISFNVGAACCEVYWEESLYGLPASVRKEVAALINEGNKANRLVRSIFGV